MELVLLAVIVAWTPYFSFIDAENLASQRHVPSHSLKGKAHLNLYLAFSLPRSDLQLLGSGGKR